MKKIYCLSFLILLAGVLISSFKRSAGDSVYLNLYQENLHSFQEAQIHLLQTIHHSAILTPSGSQAVKTEINQVRIKMKLLDFWLRYLDPVEYKKINGTLPVEWETEVFEKFEKPYKRAGAGITLAALYLENPDPSKDSLSELIKISVTATESYLADSNTRRLRDYSDFYFCNRLFLLNLAAIYTTGFECPDTTRIIPELKILMKGVAGIYASYNRNFPSTTLNDSYLALYKQAVDFVENQSNAYSQFDHYNFIRNFVNPLFAINQDLISRYRIRSSSFVDYSLNNKSRSIFSKDLYRGQNAKGIFLRVDDPEVLAEIDRLGKQLFYDPILSGNNKRSCVSCHRPTQYFTDTIATTPVEFDQQGFLARNSPSLINVGLNHLLMNDGSMISMQDQARAVITNHAEMACNERELIKKLMSCADYKKAFTKLLEYTPQEDSVTLEHISSAVTFYYNKYSQYTSPFDDAMNRQTTVSLDVQQGFNLFMGKAQCATCHFVPQFNGVKPPYVGSEFEVLGVPADRSFRRISSDSGRFLINPSEETLHAFRTGSIRNAQFTAPYMHNGVFKTLEEVIDFYDAGGGAGKGLTVTNQTLSSDSLHLSPKEKELLKKFMLSLSENIVFETSPRALPKSTIASLNKRKIGGNY